jgi:hypothetical protein
MNKQIFQNPQEKIHFTNPTPLHPTRVYLEAGNVLPEGMTGKKWNIHA